MGDLYYTKNPGVGLTDAHKLPHQLAGALHKPHQDQHIEQQLAHIVPHDGHRRKAFIAQNRRRGGKAGKDDAAQYDDAALQTDAGVALRKLLPMLLVGSPAKEASGIGAIAVAI